MFIKNFHYSIILVVFSLLLVVNGQDQSGFINLDCGLSETSSYTEPTTGINYISDAPFISTGVSKSILSQHKVNWPQQLVSLRSFPDGIRNCYKINTKKGTKYRIKAAFLYGNYDSKNKTPEFDIYLGVSFWVKIKIPGIAKYLEEEIIHLPLENYVCICLVNIGLGTPFISALELSPLTNITYMAYPGSLRLFGRWYFGPIDNLPNCYRCDDLGRCWNYYLDKKWTILTTKYQPITNEYLLPYVIMSTAVTPVNASAPLELSFRSPDPNTGFYLYFHFTELVMLKPNESRAFDINVNGRPFYQTIVLDYLISRTIRSQVATTGESNYNVSINKAKNSTLPPIWNALEIYTLVDLSQSETDQDDVSAIMNIKSTYGVKRNWDGDPCLPVNYLWEGLNCSNIDGYNPPRITSLSLNSSGLTGEISKYISDLTMLESLDLSNNSLTGSVPYFLSHLSNLRVIKLGKNKLTGSVPEELVARSKDGSLLLSVEENGDLCMSSLCEKKKTNFIIPVAASVGGLVVLLLIAAAFSIGLKINIKKHGHKNVNVNSNFRNDSFINCKKKQFSYSEVIKITNNFERILGKGRFGLVYHGFIDDIQVAVKMLSSTSVQGFHQFQAEVKILMKVYHRNLTSLVGYCNEGTNIALIYEYMANGSLYSHLLGDSREQLLSWERRLQIALDSAQGLEYLHNGCKPPIVHRNVKTSNILLTENFQAKLADFGMPKFLPTDGGSHVSTIAVGAPEYLDPEYDLMSRLNEKSDVYSFGVVLLEIITSRCAISRTHENERTHISQLVSFMLANGDVKTIVDPQLQGDFEMNSVWKTVETAMACVSSIVTRRPNMSQVVIELKESLESELARKKERRGTNSTYPNELMSLNQNVSTSFVSCTSFDESK